MKTTRMLKINKSLNTDCRTCFNTNNKLKPLTTKTRDYKKRLKSFGELLEEITEIKIKDNKYPQLPLFICVNCSRRLKSAHTFIQRAKEVYCYYYSMLNKNLDCLQETQIDFVPCIEVKIENIHQEVGKNKNLDCLRESQIDLDACMDIKVENKKQEVVKELDCLQETEIVLEGEKEIKTEKEQQNQNKLQFEMESITKEIEELPKENNSEPQITIRLKNSTVSNNIDSESESLQSNDINFEENDGETKPKVKTFHLESSELNDVAVPCKKCNKIFKNSKLLAVHQRISHIPEEKKCTCHLCGNKFTRYCNMYKHMRMFHGPETVTLISKRPEEDYIYKCDLCPKKYSRKKSLVYHTKLKHSSKATNEILENKNNTEKKEEKSMDKGSLCPICGSSFTSKNQLTVHLRRHTGERPFKCDLCERAFLLVTQLNSHKRLHTGEKPYKCQVCDKAFRVSDDLRQHIRTHTNVRPHKCSQCERSFKHPQDLKIHIRFHTGERPYVCAVCGDSFQRYNTLRTHRIRMGHVDNNSLVQNATK